MSTEFVNEAPDQLLARQTIAHVRRRLLPFMFLLYVVAYLDRINVGFAALQMNEELRFSDAVYGLGAGIFFIGYFIFEVPSNLILHRVGARLWIARIMIVWGLAAAAMMFVRTAPVFYVMRFVLGAAEAGFFPGMLLYLTAWFPPRERARAVALFMSATAIAGVIAGPVSGAILQLHGIAGLSGWQWLFLLEGVPAVLLGFVVLGFLTNTPEEASWLTADERSWLTRRLAQEKLHKDVYGESTLRRAMTSGRTWTLCLMYFGLVTAMYGVGFWLPQIVKGLSGSGNFLVGVLSAVPYLVAALGMVFVARHSDLTGERRWHIAVPCFAGAVSLWLVPLVQPPALALALLSVAALGIWSALPTIWTLPMAVLSGPAAAGGLALINSFGNLGGFAGPYLVGFAREATDSFAAGLLVLGGSLAMSGAIALSIRHDRHMES
jgi:MFS transporter, ACS family, tartrate transporter